MIIATLTALAALGAHDPALAQKLDVPTTYAITAKATTLNWPGVTRLRVFKSLGALKAEVAAGTMYGQAVAYDPEGSAGWPTPAGERAHPGRYMRAFTAYAKLHGLIAILAPARTLQPAGGYLKNLTIPYWAGQAFALQGERGTFNVPAQADELTPSVYRSFYNRIAAAALKADPHMRLLAAVSEGLGKGDPKASVLRADMRGLRIAPSGVWLSLNALDETAVARADLFLGGGA